MTQRSFFVRAVSLLASLALISACAAPVAPDTTMEKPSEYKIAAIQPLTGDAAGYGVPQINAMKIAIDEINRAGGIDGVPVQFIAEDGKCEGKSAATAAQKLASIDNVQVIVGGACSGESLAAAPIVNQAKIVLFSASSTSPDLTTQGGEYFFRNAPSDTKAGSALADRAAEMNLEQMAIISENTDFAQGIRNVFKASFKGELVADEVYNPQSTDFRAQLTRIKDANPKGLIINGQTGQSDGMIAKQAKELGFDIPFFSNETVGGGEAVEAGGLDAVKGIIFHQAAIDTTNAKAQTFLQKYQSAYGEAPAYDYYSAAAYDATYILADAIKAVGYDGTAIKEYLDAMGDYNGVLGTYTFDENGDANIDIAPRMIDETGKNVPYVK